MHELPNPASQPAIASPHMLIWGNAYGDRPAARGRLAGDEHG
jgi:hypothetical protein